MSVESIVDNLIANDGMTKGLAYCIGLAGIDMALDNLTIHPKGQEEQHFPLSEVDASETRDRLVMSLAEALGESTHYVKSLNAWAKMVDKSAYYEVTPPGDLWWGAVSLDRPLIMDSGAEEESLSLANLLSAPESDEASQRDGNFWEEAHYD